MIPITKQHFEDETDPTSLHISRVYYKNNDMILLVNCGPDYYMFKGYMGSTRENEYYELTKEEYEAKKFELKNTCDKFFYYND
jgi:hypothetical protein